MSHKGGGVRSRGEDYQQTITESKRHVSRIQISMSDDDEESDSHHTDEDPQQQSYLD